jgi:transporter family-2 protein
MNNVITLAVIAAIGGVAVALQGHFMGIMDKGIGTKESVFITYGAGAIIAGLIMLASRGGNLRAWQELPWYTLSSGLLGLIIVGTIGYTAPRLGLAKAFTVVVAAQFMVAALIDHYGWLSATAQPLGPSRLLGIGVMILGVWLITR